MSDNNTHDNDDSHKKLSDQAPAAEETGAEQHEAETEETEVTADMVCKGIREAAEEAIKSKDYISYATILDVYLSGPSRFSASERVQILKELHQVLLENNVLVLEIGWDLPALLLEFFETEYTGSVLSAPGVKEVMNIFSLLSTKGNAKEIYLKSLEALTNLEWRDEETHEDRRLHQRERAFDVKFYALFQLMQYSLTRIDAQYPSRFLATSTTTLLSFLAAQSDNLTANALAVILRRLFTFARDFETAETDKQIPDVEYEKIRGLLQAYVTWVTDLAFQRFSVRWSQRLYIEMKQKCELAPAQVRKDNYEQDRDLSGIAECVDRLAELMWSFDVNLEEQMLRLIDSCQKDCSPKGDDDDSSSMFHNISDDGLLLLYTEEMFEKREDRVKLTFEQVVKLGKRFLSRKEGGLAPYGVIDAVLFWSAWTCRNVTKQEVEKVDEKEFFDYLQLLSIIVASNIDRETSVIVNSLIAKLLSLHREEVAFNFISDTLEHCPFENVRDACIHMLKNFAIRRRPDNTVDETDLAQKVEKLDLKSDNDTQHQHQQHSNCPIIHLQSEKARLDKIKDFVMSDIDKTANDDGLEAESFPVLLSWINFLTVIETSKDFVSQVSKGCKKITEAAAAADEKDETNQKKSEFMTIALERLQKRWD